MEILIMFSIVYFAGSIMALAVYYLLSFGSEVWDLKNFLCILFFWPFYVPDRKNYSKKEINNE